MVEFLNFLIGTLNYFISLRPESNQNPIAIRIRPLKFLWNVDVLENQSEIHKPALLVLWFRGKLWRHNFSLILFVSASHFPCNPWLI